MLHLQMDPLPGSELDKIEELIRASQRDMRDTTGIDIAFLGDVVQDHPQLFKAAYKSRFPNVFDRMPTS